MLTYTLGLIRQGDQVLLLNRENPVWMGCWNGIGGKIEPNERPRAAMQREIQEETGLELDEIAFSGIVTWSTVAGEGFGGMYVYEARLDANYPYETPIRTSEGILDWKAESWILHEKNQGVATNLQSLIQVLNITVNGINHHSVFQDDKMIKHLTTPIDARIEYDEEFGTQYLRDYLEWYKSQATAVRA
jgi:8-oxo-dGTP diphosphatase